MELAPILEVLNEERVTRKGDRTRLVKYLGEEHNEGLVQPSDVTHTLRHRFTPSLQRQVKLMRRNIIGRPVPKILKEDKEFASLVEQEGGEEQKGEEEEKARAEETESEEEEEEKEEEEKEEEDTSEWDLPQPPDATLAADTPVIRSLLADERLATLLGSSPEARSFLRSRQQVAVVVPKEALRALGPDKSSPVSPASLVLLYQFHQFLLGGDRTDRRKTRTPRGLDRSQLPPEYWAMVRPERAVVLLRQYLITLKSGRSMLEVALDLREDDPYANSKEVSDALKQKLLYRGLGRIVNLKNEEFELDTKLKKAVSGKKSAILPTHCEMYTKDFERYGDPSRPCEIMRNKTSAMSALLLAYMELMDTCVSPSPPLLTREQIKNIEGFWVDEKGHAEPWQTGLGFEFWPPVKQSAFRIAYAKMLDKWKNAGFTELKQRDPVHGMPLMNWDAWAPHVPRDDVPVANPWRVRENTYLHKLLGQVRLRPNRLGIDNESLKIWSEHTIRGDYDLFFTKQAIERENKEGEEKKGEGREEEEEAEYKLTEEDLGRVFERPIADICDGDNLLYGQVEDAPEATASRRAADGEGEEEEEEEGKKSETAVLMLKLGKLFRDKAKMQFGVRHAPNMFLVKPVPHSNEGTVPNIAGFNAWKVRPWTPIKSTFDLVCQLVRDGHHWLACLPPPSLLDVRADPLTGQPLPSEAKALVPKIRGMPPKWFPYPLYMLDGGLVDGHQFRSSVSITVGTAIDLLGNHAMNKALVKKNQVFAHLAKLKLPPL